MNRAVALLSKGDAKEAIADFDEVVAAQPTSIFALLQRGIAHQQLQNWDKAIADFSAVMKLDPKHQQAISSRGYTYFLMNDPKSAVKDFSEVIKLNPKSALAYNNRGYNRQMYGEYKQALADFDKAIEVEPKFALAWQNKAWLLACCPDDKIRDGKLAFNAAKTAGELRDWKVISDVKSLAAAYAESTDFTRAVEWQKKAVAMAEGDAKTTEVELLKLYEAKTPFRFAPPKE
jgi:tetratricopeptide (TPR) repeat protein